MACAHGRLPHERCPVCELTPPFQYHSVPSVEAATSVKPSRAKMAEKVLGYIREHPRCTDEQIAAGLGMNASTARPRRIELVRQGRITSAGLRVTQAGRNATAWMVVPSDDQGERDEAPDPKA